MGWNMEGARVRLVGSTNRLLIDKPLGLKRFYNPNGVLSIKSLY